MVQTCLKQQLKKQYSSGDIPEKESGREEEIDILLQNP